MFNICVNILYLKTSDKDCLAIMEILYCYVVGQFPVLLLTVSKGLMYFSMKYIVLTLHWM